MPPRAYETHTFALPSAFGVSQSPDSQNSAGTSNIITFNAHTSPLLQKPRRRANTMPWNQGRVTFGTNTSSLRNLSAAHLNFEPVLHSESESPQTPANSTYTTMTDSDIEMEDVGTNSWVGDVNIMMEGNLPYLSNEYITIVLSNRMILIFYKS